MQGAGTESSDSTLAEGRAALDVVTRNILTRTSGRGYTLAGCLPARNNIESLWRSLRHIFHCRLCETASAFQKTTSNISVTGCHNLLIFHCPLDG